MFTYKTVKRFVDNFRKIVYYSPNSGIQISRLIFVYSKGKIYSPVGKWRNTETLGKCKARETSTILSSSFSSAGLLLSSEAPTAGIGPSRTSPP